MKRYSIQSALFLIFVVVPLPLKGRDGPISSIPDEQPTLRRVIKPSQDELVPPGTEKCVIFTREDIGKENEWNFMAGAWEFIPSRPESGVVKRVEFARSSWAARLALDDDLKIDGSARNWVLLQVDDTRGKFGYRPNLYHIDFRTWDVAFLGSEFSNVCGGNRDTLLVVKQTGIVPFDVKTATVVRGATPFEMVDRDPDTGLWLIHQREGEKESVSTFRPATLERLEQLPWPERPWQRGMYKMRSAGRADGKAWAMVAASDHADEVSPKKPEDDIQGKLWLAEAEHKNLRSWPVRFQATPGSGVAWIPSGIELWFEGRNLYFQAVVKNTDGKDVIRQWTVSGTDGAISESMVDKLHGTDQGPSPRLIPEALHPMSDHVHTSEKYLLAAYFLKSKGLLKQLPQYPDCRVGFSLDMKRFLWKTLPRYRSNPLGDLTEGNALPPSTVLLCGDLDKETVIEIPCPPELVDDNALEIEWVVTQ